MPTEISLWQIDQERLRLIPQQKLDLESRLEEWLREDISLLSNDLLVIGQQVTTAYGVSIDLLAIDLVGNLVILELKRDKTPRDVVAQVLDYAAWVVDLDHEAIEEIAGGFLKGRNLEQAFREKFGTNLPDVLNERHRMYIVASIIDPQTERIVKYLSEKQDVDVNVATFAFFRVGDIELLGRSLLLDETEVQIRAESKSKRKPSLTWQELQGLAERHGVLSLYDKALELLGPFFNEVGRTRSNVAFVGYMGPNKSHNVIMSIFPETSSASDGLAICVYMERLYEHFGVSEKAALDAFGQPVKDVLTWHGGTVFFLDEIRLQKLADLLK